MAMDRRDFLKFSGALTFALATERVWGQTAKVEVHWLGQAATKITTLTGKVIVIDPYLTTNPKTPQQHKNLDALGKVDVILVTHGHGDHVGSIGRPDGSSDVADLAKRTGAKVSGPIPLPTDCELITVNRSPVIDKKSREQFYIKTHKRLLDILNPTAKTIDALRKLDLPAGVDVEIK